nr:uncharacterized protein LOC109173053 [Ipomoea trifida]
MASNLPQPQTTQPHIHINNTIRMDTTQPHFHITNPSRMDVPQSTTQPNTHMPSSSRFGNTQDRPQHSANTVPSDTDLSDIDIGGLDLGFDEDQNSADDFRFTLVGRLITEKIIKFTFMRDTMATVWRPRKGVAAKELSNNTYLFQFFHELDMQRVLDNGPWSFEQNLLILAKISPEIPPLSMPLDSADFWVQLHDLPLGFFSDRAAMAIGNFIGEFIRTDEDAFNGWRKSFLRIRVRLNIHKPLVSQMRIRRNGGDWSWINFKYERLPNFCFICGFIGHTEMYCPKPIDDPNFSAERKFGASLRAPNRRPSPVTGNRWVVTSETLDHNTTPDPQGEDVAAGTNMNRKDGQCTICPLLQHVSTNSGTHHSPISTAGEDVTMQQIDELILADPKRKRSDVFGPHLEPNANFTNLNGPANVAKLFGFGGNTLPVIFNGVSIIGVTEWRPQSIDVTSLVFSHFKKLNRNIFVPSDTKVTIGANVQNNSGSKMATQIQTVAYTNHIVLLEALEKWSYELMEKLLPRHYRDYRDDRRAGHFFASKISIPLILSETLQLKLIHEYKRQLLNILGIVYHYKQMKEMSALERKAKFVPQVCIFGGKAFGGKAFGGKAKCVQYCRNRGQWNQQYEICREWLHLLVEDKFDFNIM